MQRRPPRRGAPGRSPLERVVQRSSELTDVEADVDVVRLLSVDLDQERRRLWRAHELAHLVTGLLLGAGGRLGDGRALRVGEELRDDESRDLRGELADEVVRDPAAVLLPLVAVERLLQLPQPVLLRGREKE